MKKLKVSKVFQNLWNSTKRIVVNRGGTRSGKTYAFCQCAALWLIYGYIGENSYIPDGTLSMVRKSLPSLKASALRDFEEILVANGWYEKVKHNKAECTYKFSHVDNAGKVHHRMVEFFSVDNQQKVRSRKREILFCPEANELDYQSSFFQLSIRTTKRIFIDFNPDDESIWINTELEQKRAIIQKDVEVFVSTYKDNPFLNEETVREIEYIKHIDEDLWRVYGMGEYGKVRGSIYKDPVVIESFPTSRCKSIFYGLDFGFNDPMALVKVGIRDKNLFIEEKYYKRMQTVDELIGDMLDMGIPRRAKIIADSADPGAIVQLKRGGYPNTRKAKKDNNSLKNGINFLRSFKWHVVATSSNILTERRRYRWKIDPVTGEAIDEPLDKFNHSLDAIRYPVYTNLYHGGGKGLTFSIGRRF